MNKYTYIIIGIVAIGILGFTFNKFSSTTKQNNSNQNTNTNKNQNKVVSNDPQDIVPGLYANPIKNISTESGLVIVSGLVENNVGKDGKPADDHLELVLKNSSAKDMNNFEAYYTITDIVTNKQEGYYKKLSGLNLKVGETKTIHFDRTVGENHFGLNTSGMYFTGKNKMKFNVQISTENFKVATLEIPKDAGGAELKD